jgi:hypothetical protein
MFCANRKLSSSILSAISAESPPYLSTIYICLVIGLAGQQAGRGSWPACLACQAAKPACLLGSLVKPAWTASVFLANNFE